MLVRLCWIKIKHGDMWRQPCSVWGGLRCFQKETWVCHADATRCNDMINSPCLWCVCNIWQLHLSRIFKNEAHVGTPRAATTLNWRPGIRYWLEIALFLRCTADSPFLFHVEERGHSACITFHSFHTAHTLNAYFTSWSVTDEVVQMKSPQDAGPSSPRYSQCSAWRMGKILACKSPAVDTHPSELLCAYLKCL